MLSTQRSVPVVDQVDFLRAAEVDAPIKNVRGDIGNAREQVGDYRLAFPCPAEAHIDEIDVQGTRDEGRVNDLQSVFYTPVV